jgi:hypothetical protein
MQRFHLSARTTVNHCGGAVWGHGPKAVGGSDAAPLQGEGSL